MIIYFSSSKLKQHSYYVNVPDRFWFDGVDKPLTLSDNLWPGDTLLQDRFNEFPSPKHFHFIFSYTLLLSLYT